MNYYDLDLGQNVFLLRIIDGEDGDLVLHIASGGKSLRDDEPAETNPALRALLQTSTRIEPDYSISWIVTFENYLQYNVMNESYTFTDKEPVVVSGKTIQQVVGSSFIRYVNEHLMYDISKAFYNGNSFRHYRINTLSHIVEIASFHEPVLKKIQKKSGPG